MTSRGGDSCTNTYDGDADNDSFQTAVCSMYSGFDFTNEVISNETVAEELTEDNIPEDCSRKGNKCFMENEMLMPVDRDYNEDGDENLSYISEIGFEEKSANTFFFTMKKNIRLDIRMDSSQSLMSLVSLDTETCCTQESTFTMETNVHPDFYSIASKSELTNSSLLSLGGTTINWFANIAHNTCGSRGTKFRSIPVTPTFFDYRSRNHVIEEE